MLPHSLLVADVVGEVTEELLARPHHLRLEHRSVECAALGIKDCGRIRQAGHTPNTHITRQLNVRLVSRKSRSSGVRGNDPG